MIAIITKEYFVHDDFNYSYVFGIHIGDSHRHLCSVVNSEGGPVGDDKSIEGITRNLLKRISPISWRSIPHKGTSVGNFAQETDIEISIDEARDILSITT